VERIYKCQNESCGHVEHGFNVHKCPKCGSPTMEKNVESLMKVVQALMAKTVERGATEAEAREAAAKVQELLQRYNIDMRAAASQDDDPAEDYSGEYVKYGEVGYERDWRRALLSSIARGNFCRIVLAGGKGTGGAYVVGQPHNIQVVMYLFNSLSVQLRHLAEEGLKTRRDRTVGPYYWKRDYVMNAAYALRERFEAQHKTNEQTTALVVSVESELDAALKKLFGQLRAGQASNIKGSMEAAIKGREAGRNIGIHAGVEGGATPKGTKMLGGNK
jgi:hypothetical protein